MRIRGLLVALVLLAALAGGLYYSNKQKAAEAAKPPADQSPKILSLTEGDISKIVLKKKGADETDLQKTGGKWAITAPMPFAADQDAANQLASSASSVSSDRVVEDKASSVSAYGLDSPALEVDITGKGGKISRLKIGDDTPTNSEAVPPANAKSVERIRTNYSVGMLRLTTYSVVLLAILATFFVAALTQGPLLPVPRIFISLFLGGLYPAIVLAGLSSSVPAAEGVRRPTWETVGWLGFIP